MIILYNWINQPTCRYRELTMILHVKLSCFKSAIYLNVAIPKCDRIKV